MQKTIKLETPEEASKYLTYLNELERSSERILTSASFFRKSVPMKEKLEFIWQISQARLKMWDAIFKKYPELRDVPSISISTSFITVEEQGERI